MIDPTPEALVIELEAQKIADAVCDNYGIRKHSLEWAMCKASALQALRTGQLAPVQQPSGDVVEAVARAIMVTNGACFVKDWTTERRDNPHVALAWDQATAAITAYEAASGVAKMREALRPFANVTILPDGSVVGLERHWFTDARAALGEKP